MSCAGGTSLLEALPAHDMSGADVRAYGYEQTACMDDSSEQEPQNEPHRCVGLAHSAYAAVSGATRDALILAGESPHARLSLDAHPVAFHTPL